MKLLITGSSGQIGTELVLRAPLSWSVLATDHTRLDITDETHVKKVIGDFMPNVIINAAAYTAVDRAENENELAYAINRDGARNLAQAANMYAARLLHISTDYVFAGDKTETYSEDDIPDPTGVYGNSKLAGEMAVVKACPEYIIIRTSWVFGTHGNNFVKTMIRLGKEKKQLSIVGDQFGGPTYAGDVADTLLAIAAKTLYQQNPVWGIYHYSGMPYTSWAGFAAAIFDHACQERLFTDKPAIKIVTTSEYPTLAQRPANSRLDCSKINKIFNVKPSDWHAALSDIASYQ